MDSSFCIQDSRKTINNIEASKLDTFVFYIVIIDLMFLPYMRMLSSSISMLILPVWYLFSTKKIAVSREFKSFLIGICCIIISFVLSIVYYPGNIKPNLINTVILVYGFLYYFFFYYYFAKKQIEISVFLNRYVYFGFLLGLIYFFNPAKYFMVRAFWTMGGNVIEVKNSLLIHRFTGTFSDPNNAAIMFVGIATFLIFNTDISFKKKIPIILLTSFIIVNTMSSTGIVLLSILLLLIVVTIIWDVILKNRIKISSIVLTMIVFPLIIVFLLYFLNTDIASMAIQRLTENTTSSRTSIWKYLLENENIFKRVLWGMGGTIIADNTIIKPHNGHLYLIYNYGFILYGVFISIFFWLKDKITLRNNYFLIPLFLGFTMNVGIYELRFIGLLALLVASYSISCRKCELGYK